MTDYERLMQAEKMMLEIEAFMEPIKEQIITFDVSKKGVLYSAYNVLGEKLFLEVCEKSGDKRYTTGDAESFGKELWFFKTTDEHGFEHTHIRDYFPEWGDEFTDAKK